MTIIFNISFTFFVVFLVWGVVAKVRKRKSRWKLLVSLLSLVVAFIVASFPEDKSVSSNSNVQTTSLTNESDEGLESEINYSLGITPEQFIKNFNDLVKKQGLSDFYHLDQVNIKNGQANVNTFSEQLTNRLAISGTVNKADGTLGFVQIILVPDGTKQDNIDLNNSILLLTTVIDPNITQEGIDYISYQVMENLTSDNRGKTIYENGYEYTTIKTAYGLIYRISKSVE